jgi:hypothetical protein
LRGAMGRTPSGGQGVCFLVVIAYTIFQNFTAYMRCRLCPMA